MIQKMLFYMMKINNFQDDLYFGPILCIRRHTYTHNKSYSLAHIRYTNQQQRYEHLLFRTLSNTPTFE